MFPNSDNWADRMRGGPHDPTFNTCCICGRYAESDFCEDCLENMDIKCPSCDAMVKPASMHNSGVCKDCFQHAANECEAIDISRLKPVSHRQAQRFTKSFYERSNFDLETLEISDADPGL